MQQSGIFPYSVNPSDNPSILRHAEGRDFPDWTPPPLSEEILELIQNLHPTFEPAAPAFAIPASLTQAGPTLLSKLKQADPLKPTGILTSLVEDFCPNLNCTLGYCPTHGTPILLSPIFLI
jgi:hypothetical protein